MRAQLRLGSNRAECKQHSKMRPDENRAGAEHPLLIPAVRASGSLLHFTVNGAPATCSAGRTVLAAILVSGTSLNTNEASGEPRAGFCLMGACQDCWVWLEDGTRLRACTTPIADGMAILTEPPTRLQRNG
jgi:hypothetical protein